MRTIKRSNRFKRDYRREARGQYSKTVANIFSGVVKDLADDVPLKPMLRDHALGGNWEGYRECHLKPDLLLIYCKDGDALELVRLGSHSELGL